MTLTLQSASVGSSLTPPVGSSSRTNSAASQAAISAIDDPGAGKTIMAGLLFKEPKLRNAVERVLILAPAPDATVAG